MTERRTFQETKRELADLDEGYLVEVITRHEADLRQAQSLVDDGVVDDLIGLEIASDYLNLARLGLWVVQREQQSRRN